MQLARRAETRALLPSQGGAAAGAVAGAGPGGAVRRGGLGSQATGARLAFRFLSPAVCVPLSLSLFLSPDFLQTVSLSPSLEIS